MANVKAISFAVVLISYFVLIHIAVLKGQPQFASMLLLLPLLMLIRGWRLRLLVGLGFVAALQWGISLGQMPPLYYLPPIIINLMLALLFGRTLRRGATPLITQYSILLRKRLEPDVVVYTRRVTQLWTGLFLLLAGESLLLALFAPLEIWSLFANLLNYMFTAVFFVGEYLFRLRHLSRLEHPGFFEFLRSVASIHASKLHRPD